MLKSLTDMGQVMTQLTLGSSAARTGSLRKAASKREDTLVMDIKLKIIEILQVCGERTGADRMRD